MLVINHRDVTISDLRKLQLLTIAVHSNGALTLTLLIYFEWGMSCIAELNCGFVALRYWHFLRQMLNNFQL